MAAVIILERKLSKILPLLVTKVQIQILFYSISNEQIQYYLFKRKKEPLSKEIFTNIILYKQNIQFFVTKIKLKE